MANPKPLFRGCGPRPRTACAGQHRHGHRVRRRHPAPTPPVLAGTGTVADPADYRDLVLTAHLEPNRWSTTVDAHLVATLDPDRYAAHLEDQ